LDARTMRRGVPLYTEHAPSPFDRSATNAVTVETPTNAFTSDFDDEMVGTSPAFIAMLAQLRRIASSEAPVLIEGETGCGKELAARAIHYRGVRHGGPFVAVNCGALPDHLLEAELFGHERGAFTDAKVARRGLVAEANGGTLFLDEVDALTTKAQVALLRFLQDQRYRPLGSSRELSTDVRLVAATNRPLADLLQQGCFRTDLMYRLKILHLALPPLRDRIGDAELLVQHFARIYCAKYGMAAKSFEPSVVAWVRTQQWPGNVRELENWVHRALLMDDGTVAQAVPDSSGVDADANATTGLESFQKAKEDAVRRFERSYVIEALRQTRGNVTQAAAHEEVRSRPRGQLASLPSAFDPVGVL
jgi:two-component system, NtrC family, response regulator GlrR